MKLGQFLKKALDLLPFNGHKFDIGALLGSLALLGELGVSPDDILMAAKAIIANPSVPAIVLIVVGLVHKALKAKFGASIK